MYKKKPTMSPPLSLSCAAIPFQCKVISSCDSLVISPSGLGSNHRVPAPLLVPGPWQVSSVVTRNGFCGLAAPMSLPAFLGKSRVLCDMEHVLLEFFYAKGRVFS